MTSLTTRPAAAPAGPRQHGPDTRAAVRCHYAGDPALRPHRTLTAEIRIGPVALCGSCAAARSTLGKGTVPAALPPGPAIDVLDWVTGAGAAARQARRDLAGGRHPGQVPGALLGPGRRPARRHPPGRPAALRA